MSRLVNGYEFTHPASGERQAIAAIPQFEIAPTLPPNHREFYRLAFSQGPGA